MKNLSKLILAAALAVCTSFGGNAWASPVTFVPDLGGSSVSATDSAYFGDIAATLMLSPSSFTIGDGATKTLDFFTLTASGFALDKTYQVEATLAFLAPAVAGTGSGQGKFSTVFGLLSGGTLTWDQSTLPDLFTLADGNTVSIDFEDGCAFGLGNTAMVHAFVTNQGGAAPVPEPGTFALLGLGLAGLAIVRRVRGR